MAISTSSLRALIDAFAVMTEKDSISPSTVATVFYRLADLLDTASSQGDIEAVNVSLNSIARNLAAEVSRAEGAERNLSAALAALDGRVSEAESTEQSLTEGLAALERAVEAHKGQTDATDRGLQKGLDELQEGVARERERALKAEGQLQQMQSATSTAIDDETRRARAAEADLTSRIGNVSHALAQEAERSQGKDGLHEEAIDLLKRQIAYEQTRAKNAETAIIGYLIAILRSQANGPEGATVTVNFALAAETIWEILESAPQNAVYQGIMEERRFTMMHAATERVHILMWLSDSGIQLCTVSREGDECKVVFSQLSLYD